MSKYKLINTETGEILDSTNVDDVRLVTIEPGSRIITPAQIEFLRKKEERHRDKTPYIWANFKYNEEYLPNIKDVNIPKMIYFATFCNDIGYVMTKNDIKGTLKINPNQVKQFKENLLKEKIIYLQDNDIYISNNYFYKGALLNTKTNFIRIYRDANRKLYSSCTVTEHKQLSYIYRMIPYINRQSNILSYNQQEQDIEHIQYMTFKKFCNIIGYDSSHSSRLKKSLSTFRINGELVVGFFDNISELNPKGKYVVVNPRFFYGGEVTKKVYKDIINLFVTEKEWFI